MAIKRIYDGFLPGRHPIEGYGSGGFRFAGISHQGSILALPSGVHAFAAQAPTDVTEEALAPVFAEADEIDLLLLGMGALPFPIGEALRWRFRDAHVAIDVMHTNAAAQTYNILLGEGRRVGAALIAVD